MRWFHAARYVVALALTALIVTVIVHAVHVLLRPNFLIIRVGRSSVPMKPGTPAGNLSFELDLEFANPSGRVAIYYEGITAYLFGTEKNASEGYFATIPITDGISLKPHSTLSEYVLAYPPFNRPDLEPYFHLFNSTGSKGIPGGIVVVNGTLTVGLYSWRNRTGKAAAYYCWPVAIGGDYSSRSAEGDAECLDKPPAPYVKIFQFS